MVSDMHNCDANTATVLLRDIRHLHHDNAFAVRRTNALLLTASTVFQAVAAMLAPCASINIDVSDLVKDKIDCEVTNLPCEGVQDDGDATLRHLLMVGATQLSATLPHIPDWLAADRDGRVMRTLQGIVALYGHTLLREPQLRRTWRRISAALHNVLEQTDDPRSRDLVHELLQHIEAV